MNFQTKTTTTSDNRNTSGYTTRFEKSQTLAVQENNFIIKINFRMNSHQSSSWNDKELLFLGKNGWVSLGTSNDINYEFENSTNIDGITENCEAWTEACLKYFEDISIAL